MSNTYSVSVYDCSFVQDYVMPYTRFFESKDDAINYAISLMDDFSYRGLYEYTVELGIETLCKGQYNTIGFWEFDYMSYDGDLADDFDTLTECVGSYSYHLMF